MKKTAVALSALMALCMFAGCGGPSAGGEEPDDGQTPVTPEEPAAKEILFDPFFREGIAVSALDSQAVSFTWWKYGDADAAVDPYWSLGQYCDLARTRPGYDTSVNDLSLDTIFEEGNGITKEEGSEYVLTNVSGSKEMRVDPSAGTVALNVDTSKEYIDQATGEFVPRAEGEDWVHMILSQSPGTVNLSQVDSFVMSLDFCLDACDVYVEDGYACQFQWIFSVHDKSGPVDDYFWFNVTLFDNRYEVFPGTQMFDGGKADSTGKFIYAPTGEQLFGESGGKVEVGKNYHVELDLKEYMRQAFEIGQSMGAMEHASWENLVVNGFNIGWEVTSVAKACVTISNLSLKTA